MNSTINISKEVDSHSFKRGITQIKLFAEVRGEEMVDVVITDFIPDGVLMDTDSIILEPNGLYAEPRITEKGMIYFWKFENVSGGSVVGVSFEVQQIDDKIEPKSLFEIYTKEVQYPLKFTPYVNP